MGKVIRLTRRPRFRSLELPPVSPELQPFAATEFLGELKEMIEDATGDYAPGLRQEFFRKLAAWAAVKGEP